MPGADGPISVAMDATPLVGTRTGVGVAVAGYLGALAARRDLDITAYAMSARRWRDLRGHLPAGVRAGRGPMPAGLLTRLWAKADHPVVETWTGAVDLVHGTNFVVPPARGAARLVTVHDLTPVRFPELCQPGTRRYPELIRRAIRQGASVHAVSGFVAGEVVEAFDVDPGRVHVVCNGFAPPPRPTVVPGGPPYVLALGTTEPRKGFPDLVAAFDLVAESLPELRLTIAGPPGWAEDELQAAIGRAVHRGRIDRVGWVEDTTALMAGARAFAYPSLYEGFGFPPLEALALGVPVVATSAGAIPEVVGDAALLVAPRDVDALAGALRAACDDEAVRRRLADRAPSRVSTYTWDRAGRELAELYRSLLLGRGSSAASSHQRGRSRPPS